MQDFFFYKASVQSLELAQPASQWVLGVKWPEREDDHYNPSNAGIKNEWRCTVGAVLSQTSEGMNIPYLFHVWYISVSDRPPRIIFNF